MKIAITGATGFLGRYLVRQLVGAGHTVRGWYRPTSDRGGFDDVAGAVEWQPGALNDPAATGALIRGADAVIHAAVEWAGPGNRRQEQEADTTLRFMETNLMGSLRLFEAAYRAGVPRVVYVASCAVHEVILPGRPLDETHPLWPTSHYGAHKAALEAFVHSYGLGQGWPICSVRPTGIYGLDHPAARSRWYDLVGRVVRGEPIESAKGGKEVHARDVARACELLLTADAGTIAGQAYNCTDRYVAEEEVARIAKELTGSGSQIAERNRGPKNLIATDKLRALGMTFGGTPLLRETVARLVAAHREGRS